MTNFENQLKFGKTGESIIAKLFNYKDYSVLPIYETIIDTGKGPQLFTKNENYIAPDMIVFKKNKTFWIEAKTKTVFSWHRISKQWVTGIDIRHYNDYIKILNHTNWPIWLMFLHLQNFKKDINEPYPCPSGLFGQKLNILVQTENHRSDKHGTSGMVYWAHNNLRLFFTIQEIKKIIFNYKTKFKKIS